MRRRYLVGSALVAIFSSATVVSSSAQRGLPAAAAGSTMTVPAASQPADGSARGGKEGRKHYFLEMGQAAAAEIYAAGYNRYFEDSRFVMRGSQDEIRKMATERAAAEALQQAWSLDSAQRAVVNRLGELNVEILYRAQTAVNGVAVLADSSQLEALTAIAGVTSVREIVLQKPDAVTSVNFIGTRSIWNTAGINAHGEGVGVAVIDSGNDFVHTGNGGPGGTSYNANVTSVDGTTPARTFPTSKVVWGYDFCGDAYNGANAPVRDQNPMDTNGHGTACGGLIAGFGVNANGTTYTGPYDAASPDISALSISPGIAPQAQIYSLRVFGTAGSTGLSEQAVSVATAIRIWQLSPEGTPLPPEIANLTPAPVALPRTPVLSVVNMSLGSGNGYANPYNSGTVAVQNASGAGLSMIISAGNSYDSYYVVGSPSVATGSISIAATYNSQQPGFTATAPANGAQPALNLSGLVGTAAFSTAPNSLAPTAARYANPREGNFQHAGPPPGGAGGTPTQQQTVALLNDANEPVSDAAGNPLNPPGGNPYIGKVVLIDRGDIGFHNKGVAAQRAGAAAVVIVNNRPGAAPGMAAGTVFPNITIPAVSVSQDDSRFFTNTGTPNTPPVRPGLNISIAPENAGNADGIADYSSRGPRRGDNRLKPDMAAPAENVSTINTGTGNGGRNFNGTSSAAPHVAGAMALLRQVTNSATATPAWSMEELKALIMNAASGNPFVGGSAGTQRFGLGRVGLGRLNLDPAGGLPTAVALSTDAEFPVSVSFGVVDVPVTNSNFQVEKTFKVVNKETTGQARTFNLGFDYVTPVPGVSFSFPDGPSVTVGPGATTTARVLMTVNGGALRHARDLSTTPEQTFSIANILAVARLPRTFPTEAAGNILLTETSGDSMRLSVHSVPRPNSTLGVTPALLNLPVAPETQTFTLTGSGINSGPNINTVANPVADIRSHAKAFEMQYNKGAVQTDAFFRTAEITHVGVTSDVPRRLGAGANPYATTPANTAPGVVVFAVATAADFTTPSSTGTDIQVLIDTNGNGTEEFTVRSFAWNDPTYGSATFGSNMYLSVTNPFGSTTLTTTGYFTNITSGEPNNMLNNNLVMLPVDLQRLGITQAGNKRISYKVRASFYFGTFISETPWLTYDVTKPGVDASAGTGNEPFVFAPAAAGNTFPVAIDQTNHQANRSLGMLMVYPHNGPGARVQAISVGNRLFVSGFAPASGPVGTQVTVTGSGFTGATSVSFGTTAAATFTVDSDTQIRANVPAGATNGTIRVATPAGRAASTRKFVVTQGQ